MELDYCEIGKNIRKYRRERGMMQKDLAERICMSEQHISHIESAHTKLSLPTLVAIANALEVDCNTLLGETLTGARGTILHEQIEDCLSKMNLQKLRLCADLCRLLIDYDI